MSGFLTGEWEETRDVERSRENIYGVLGLSLICSSIKLLLFFSGDIANGYLRLPVVTLKDNTKHVPLTGTLGLSWETDALKGNVKVSQKYFSVSGNTNLETELCLCILRMIIFFLKECLFV